MFVLRESPENAKTMKFLYELPVELTKAIRKGAYISGKQLVDDLRKDMTLPKSGKTYKVYKGIGGKQLKKPRIHQASSSSETPSVVTGEFRKSIDFAVRGNKALEFGSGKDYAQEYAKLLELGTSKMEARKPLGRTVDKLKFKVKSNIDTEVKKALGGQK